jgi:hypothetical protein
MDTQPTRVKQKSSKFEAQLLVFLRVVFFITLLVVTGAIAAAAGYQDGYRQAEAIYPVDDRDFVQEQFELGQQDFEAGDYGRARQRFEYVIALEPDKYPTAWTYLTEILAIFNATATFTPIPSTATSTPTATITPTRDPSGEESIFNRAASLLTAGDWSGAIDAIIALRNEDLLYRVVQSDDILYAALRIRGEERILRRGDLEGGIYDLTLAENFGPLDYGATVYRDWARLYLTALGFWEAYPEQAVYYFGQVAAAVPGLSDASGWTSSERYRMSLIHYGDKLASEDEWCQAQMQYELALAMGEQPNLQATLTHVTYKCSPPTQTITFTSGPTSSPTITLTPTIGPSPTFTETPLASSTPTATLAQSATYTSTPAFTATETATELPTETSTSLPTETDTPIPSATNTDPPPPTATNTDPPPPTATNTDPPPPTETETPVP